jgi:hypothetical protein
MKFTLPAFQAGASETPDIARPIMRRLDFKEASEIIRVLDADLEDALRAVWDQATSGRRSELSFVLARYPYKSFVFKNGRALDPDGGALQADLVVTKGLPVGLILDNVLEVIDEVIRNGRNGEVIEFPQSLLFKKELIGLWELFDEQFQVEGSPTANWTISSGARNLKFLEFPTQKVKYDRLRARYPRLSTHDKADIRRLKEIDLIEIIDDKCRRWATEILYFSPAWFNELARQRQNRETAFPANKLFVYFQKHAWSTLARVRYNDDQLTDALTEWGGDLDASRCKAAYLLLRHSYQIINQRRPCFGLADGSDPLGPLDVIRRELLQVAHLNQAILGPMYLQRGGVGFLPLSQLVPSAFEQNPEDSLEKIFKIISRAREAAARRDVVIPGLDDLPGLFSKLTFCVKSGRQRQKGRHGSVRTFKVHCGQSTGGTFPRPPVPVEAFYEPVFSGASLPTPDSRFFRVAVKLDLRERTNIPEY